MQMTIRSWKCSTPEARQTVVAQLGNRCGNRSKPLAWVPERLASGECFGMGPCVSPLRFLARSRQGEETKGTKKTILRFALMPIRTVFVTFVVLALPSSC